MHGQCMPQSKPTWKHVIFWLWPSADFDRSEIACCETWTLKFKPRHLSHTKTCQLLTGDSTCVLMHGQPKPPKHIPIETCNVSRVMFWPYGPIFLVPPCDPHPCPMTHPWCFRSFSTLHCCHVFFCWISNVFIIAPPPKIYLGFW